jgi:amidase
MNTTFSRLSRHCAWALLIILSCTPDKQPEEKPKRINLDEITLSQLRTGYDDGTFTIREVVQEYLLRIEEVDKNGPALNSIIYINPDALMQAEELDRELADGKKRGPMHGIPVILKDNIDTQDMPTTAGAVILQNSYPKYDSRLTKKLKEAGAIIIAKSNLSEWANFRAMISSSGWSGVGGQTKNPYVLDRSPCGSSSGSGVAVAANLCALSIGTETNGSIVCPANNNGIVGLKPTVGLISRAGIIPISFSQDTPGPMGRTVEDVAFSLGVMVGVDSADSKTLASVGNGHSDYTQFLVDDGLKGKRIGVLKNSSGFHPKVDALMKEAIEELKKQGASVVEVELKVDEAEQASFQVMLYEFKDGLNDYLSKAGAPVPARSISELIAFNKADETELRYFDQQLLEMADKKGDLQSKEYIEALATMYKLTREEGIDRVMDRHNLDALVAPTGTAAWKTDLINGDHFIGGSSSLAAISGYPAISVPMGFIDNLPVGISFFGAEWSEPTLISIAYSYEQATKHRKKPLFLPTD